MGRNAQPTCPQPCDIDVIDKLSLENSHFAHGISFSASPSVSHQYDKAATWPSTEDTRSIGVTSQGSVVALRGS